MSVAVLTDSNSGITQEEAKSLGLYVVAMPFLVDGVDHLEGVDLPRDKFYERLIGGGEVSTSQPSNLDVKEILDNLLKTHDEVLYIPTSSALSNSCESAKVLATGYDGKVVVVDNRRISIIEKQCAVDAVKLAKEGKSAKEIADWLMATKDNASVYIMLTTLKYLKKGGRLTPAAALLGTVFGVKPILTIQGGKLDKFAQALSVPAGKKKMLEQVEKELNTRFRSQLEQGKLAMHVAYTYDKKRAEEFRDEINKYFEKYNIEVNFVDELSMSIAIHVGENALALGICEKV